MDTAVVVVAHGSKASTANQGVYEIVDMVRAMDEHNRVEVAFLQLAEPTLRDSVQRLVIDGARKIVVMPALLFMGNHVMRDIPEVLEKLRTEFPHVEFCYTSSLAPDVRIAEIIRDRIREALTDES